MAIFPPDDEQVVPAEEHERFHSGGHRNLPWRDEFAARGRAFDLAPGQAVHVPFMAPHWVKNGPEVSVSFSITWRSEWSYREEYAHRMNALLRKAGQPRPSQALPAPEPLVARLSGHLQGPPVAEPAGGEIG